MDDRDRLARLSREFGIWGPAGRSSSDCPITPVLFSITSNPNSICITHSKRYSNACLSNTVNRKMIAKCLRRGDSHSKAV